MASRGEKRYQDMVGRFEKAAQTNLPNLPAVADLCALAAVSHRSLLRAFRLIRDTTPSNYLRELRLTQARNALLSRKEAPRTVTQVAMHFGFRELGRFAADYRVAFGENPSDTLRRTIEKAYPGKCSVG